MQLNLVLGVYLCCADCEEVNFSEAWYDAEEELQLPGPAAAADISLTSDMADNAESVGEESSCSVLYVSNLPNNVTQSDVKQLFKDFQPSNVSISTLKNNVRVAIVIVEDSEAAEAAVRELSGIRMHNHSFHIRRLTGADGEDRPSASTCVSKSLQDAATAPTSDTDWRFDKKLVDAAPGSSSIHRKKVVCILPTAKGTFVPQHFGTMGSLDTLMAELTQLHPHADRQAILDALMELKATHQGVLVSLPLSTIRDMTSDLLTTAATATRMRRKD